MTIEQQRAAARLAAEQIDRIESEMTLPVSGPATSTRSGPPTARGTPLGPPSARGTPAGSPKSPRPSTPAGPAARTPDPKSAVASMQEQQAALEKRAAPAALAPLEFHAPSAPAAPAAEPAQASAARAAEAIQVRASTLPADLEEAAILYANDQADAAIASLQSALARDELAERTQLAWMMLLDVLQASGRRAEFDAQSVAYAARFECSPPPWQEAVVPEEMPKRAMAQVPIVFGARLDASIQKLVEQGQKAGLQRRAVLADFSAVRSADAAGAAMVAGLLELFIRANREIAVRGARQLLEAARAGTQQGRRDENPGAWHLALVALRLLGDRQAFEDLSIEYCVTYEVSPPPWEPLPARVTLDETAPAAAGAAQAAPVAPAAAAAEAAGATPISSVIEDDVLKLRGSLIGLSVAEFALLRSYALDRDDVAIDLRMLLRVDFVAAGELLNEVALLRGAGKTVLLIEPSPMVEALFLVIGILELATLRRRRW